MDFTLDDVSVKFNDSDSEDFNEDTLCARRKGNPKSWVTNIRRRVYDALNVQMAAGFLHQNEHDCFEVNKGFDRRLA